MVALVIVVILGVLFLADFGTFLYEQLKESIMADLSNITREVAETRGVTESAVVLINSLGDKVQALADELAQNGVDVTAIQALADELDDAQADLAAAVAENSPAPAPEPAPVDEGEIGVPPLPPSDEEPAVVEPDIEGGESVNPDAPAPAEQPEPDVAPDVAPDFTPVPDVTPEPAIEGEPPF